MVLHFFFFSLPPSLFSCSKRELCLADKKSKGKESVQTPAESPKASEAENAVKLENAGDKATPVVKLKLSGKGITIKVSPQEPR